MRQGGEEFEKFKEFRSCRSSEDGSSKEATLGVADERTRAADVPGSTQIVEIRRLYS